MQELKDFVAKGRSGRQDSIVEMIVADWPAGASFVSRGELRAEISKRLKVRMKKKYGSVLGLIIFSAIANFIINRILEWWFSSANNSAMMTVWKYALQTDSI